MAPEWWKEKLQQQAYLMTMFLRAATGGMFAVQYQYLYRRVASSHTDDLASLANVSDSDSACSTTKINTSSEEYQVLVGWLVG
jgi:hypothetical protein